MSEDIIGTRQLLGQAYGPRTGPLPAHVEPKIRKIAHGLDDFKTPYPQITGENSHQEWSSFLIRLQPALEMGNLDYAKSIWKELQEEAAKSVI